MLLATIALVLLAPVLLFFTVAVVTAMGRPVFFRQTRAGRGGVSFTLVKFRSMRETCDAAGKLLPDDKRITVLGRLLRRSRLDELPELWNIIRGDMAFIGPRPLLPETVAAMAEDGIKRGKLRPGLTGWAQVNGNSLLTPADKLALDLWYVDQRSLAIDLNILFRTLGVMIAGERINPISLEKAYACHRHRCG
ncbi:sugar transferase [Rhizorhapis sp. SPR117]|uniref:sugar transferase n=1 Tax=Rhizorhapis sp. SPR117 TaxID=2912611 RepID=UPI001F29C9F1|nr:sugar transferase [Rhizorhapis sp. SPR117]